MSAVGDLSVTALGEFDIVPSFQSGNRRLRKCRYIRLFEVHPPAQFGEMNWEYILVREQLGTIDRIFGHR